MEVQFLAINELGHSSGIDTAVENVSLPLLQDDSTQEVWSNWGVTYRDVIILDSENKISGVLNLTTNPLAEEANWNQLKELVLSTAGEVAAPVDTGIAEDTDSEEADSGS